MTLALVSVAVLFGDRELTSDYGSLQAVQLAQEALDTRPVKLTRGEILKL